MQKLLSSSCFDILVILLILVNIGKSNVIKILISVPKLNKSDIIYPKLSSKAYLKLFSNKLSI